MRVGARVARIGVTGGIGAGKSTITRLFSLLEVPIYDADRAAKYCMQQEAALRLDISRRFGRAAYDSEGKLNAHYLAQRIFRDEDERYWLENRVHPAVRANFQSWLERQKTPYVLYEAALLLETAAYKQLDRTLLVVAPKSLRLRRVLSRDPRRSAAEVRRIMSTQISEEQALSLISPEHTLRNDEHNLLTPKVLSLHQKIIADMSALK